MNINNRLASLITRLLIVCVGAVGILFYAIEIRSVGIIKYYSVITALVAVIFYAYLTLKTAVELKYSGLKGVTMLDILPRGLVLSGILSSVILNIMIAYRNISMVTLTKSFEAEGRLTFAGILLNIIFPILVFTDWALFNKKFRFKCRDALLWLLYPISFFVAHLIRNSLMPDLEFVYYFLDYKSMGFHGVVINIIVLSIIFIISNLFFVLADTALGSPMVLFSWTKEDNIQLESNNR